jgi:hypothetical protein
MVREFEQKFHSSLQKWFGRLAKLAQVGCFGDEATGLVVAKTPKAAGCFIVLVRGVKNRSGKRHGCLFPRNWEQRRQEHLEEHGNPMRGVTREEANYRIEGTRLRVEQGLGVGERVCGHLFAGEQASSQRRGGTVLLMKESTCMEWINPWTG